MHSQPIYRSHSLEKRGTSILALIKDVDITFDKNIILGFQVIKAMSPLEWVFGSTYSDATRFLADKASFAVVSVCEAEHSPLWCGHLPASQEFENFINVENMKQRQAGGKFYRLNGAIYIVDIKRFTTDRFLYQKGSYAYIMRQDQSVDIDTDIDFQFAELLMKRGTL